MQANGLRSPSSGSVEVAATSELSTRSVPRVRRS